MKHAFIVPGGRFIEMYYWDTYWTIEGLLVCDMFETSRKMLENFMYFIQLFGFIPNGSRVYYLNRSQPPYFALMVKRYYESTMKSNILSLEEKNKIKNFVLDQALECIIKEYEYWMKNKITEVEINNQKYILNIYKAFMNKPRPESYFEDLETSSKLSEDRKEKIYQDISSGAESGYDFSSRWFEDPLNMSTIRTTDIIPVDLNAILYKTELIISDLYLLKGDLENSKLFEKKSIQRKFTINKILWSEENYCWADYNMKTKKLNNQFYITNLAPLYMGLKPPNEILEKNILDKNLRKIFSENFLGVQFL